MAEVRVEAPRSRSRRPKKNKAKKQSQMASLGEGSSSNNASNGTSTFQEGEDFIRLEDEDSEDGEISRGEDPVQTRAESSYSQYDRKGKGQSRFDRGPFFYLFRTQDVKPAHFQNEIGIEVNAVTMTETGTGTGTGIVTGSAHTPLSTIPKPEYSTMSLIRRRDKRLGCAISTFTTPLMWLNCAFFFIVYMHTSTDAYLPRLHYEVAAFTKWISPTKVEDEIRALTVTFITNVVKSAFPDADVRSFGSYETKLYLPLG